VPTRRQTVVKPCKHLSPENSKGSMNLGFKLHPTILEILVFFFFLTLGWPLRGQDAASSRKLTDERWREDLKFLSEEMPKRHANLFHSMSSEHFHRYIETLSEDVPKLSDQQITTRIAQLISTVGDGHTGVNALPLFLRRRYYPLKLYIYSDGVFVQATDPAHEEILGARLVEIDGHAVAEVLDRVEKITDGTNEFARKDFMPFRMVRPETLQTLDLVKDGEHAPYTFEKDGRRFTVILEPMGRSKDGTPIAGGIWDGPGVKPGTGWRDARGFATRPTPLWLKRPEEAYWYEYVPASRTLYVQCNAVTDTEKETLAGFFERVFAFADRHLVDRFVLDLRMNGGGDNTLLMPVIHSFIRHERINRRGNFFTIIGRRTQSAAQNFVNLLQIHTNTIFVGEPTGESPNHYGDPEPLLLPNSQIRINVASVWWQDMGPRDHRPWTPPDIPAELSSKSYANNVDPAMDAILAYPRVGR
jgi:hypothetical protein